MSYFNPTVEENLLACVNCDTTNGPIETYMTYDGEQLPLCPGCCEAEAYTERLADQLAALPSCDVRQGLIDAAETTRGMVNALTAHDQACGCAKPKPITTVVEQWNGTGWTERKLTWNGSAFVDQKAVA